MSEYRKMEIHVKYMREKDLKKENKIVEFIKGAGSPMAYDSTSFYKQDGKIYKYQWGNAYSGVFEVDEIPNSLESNERYPYTKYTYHREGEVYPKDWINLIFHKDETLDDYPDYKITFVVDCVSHINSEGHQEIKQLHPHDGFILIVGISHVTVAFEPTNVFFNSKGELVSTLN